MARAHFRGGDASLTLPSSDHGPRDSGSLLDAMGSASSLASNSSSVFSANAPPASSNGHLSSATPLTHPDVSPAKPRSPYPSAKSHHRAALANGSPNAHFAPAETPPAMSSENATPRQSPPIERPQARPPPGAVKGYRAVWDPELDNKLSDKEKKRAKPKIRAFGAEVRLEHFITYAELVKIQTQPRLGK